MNRKLSARLLTALALGIGMLLETAWTPGTSALRMLVLGVVPTALLIAWAWTGTVRPHAPRHGGALWRWLRRAGPW